MKPFTFPSSLRSARHHLSGLTLGFVMIRFIFGPVPLLAAEAPALVDDFSAAEHTSVGAPRLVITDQQMGGQSRADTAVSDGVMRVSGELKPGRGAPGFVSIPLLLRADAQPVNLTDFTGIRLRVRVTQGMLAVQAASAVITNFDFHTSAPIARRGSDLQEVQIPFAAMKRAWSEQTPIDLTTVTSINLVAAGMAPGAFAYVVDEVGFY